MSVSKTGFSSVFGLAIGTVAQLVEHRTENPGVTGSIPVRTTMVTYCRIIRTELREGKLWLLLSRNGIEVPYVPVAMVDDYDITDSGRRFVGSIGLFWWPLSKVIEHSGLPKPTSWSDTGYYGS